MTEMLTSLDLKEVLPDEFWKLTFFLFTNVTCKIMHDFSYTLVSLDVRILPEALGGSGQDQHRSIFSMCSAYLSTYCTFFETFFPL